MDTQFGYFANYGFLRDQVPTELLKNLKDEISEIDLVTSENKHNRNLAGNIEHEYKLSKNSKELEKYLLTLCDELNHPLYQLEIQFLLYLRFSFLIVGV